MKCTADDHTCGGALEHVLKGACKARDVGGGASHVKADDLHLVTAALPLSGQRKAHIPASHTA